MTSEEQDKLWAELSEESKEQMRERYNKPIEDSDPNAEYFRGIRYQTGIMFGSHNLQLKLTYDDVAMELFEDGYYYYDYVYGRLVTTLGRPNMPMACTSQNQVRKLCAINRILNVAKFLNKNEDGSDWEPDWKNNEKKWELIIDSDDNVLIGYCMKGNTCPVYFRTEAIAKQCVEILGEEAIKTALSANY